MDLVIKNCKLVDKAGEYHFFKNDNISSVSFWVSSSQKALEIDVYFPDADKQYNIDKKKHFFEMNKE